MLLHTNIVLPDITYELQVPDITHELQVGSGRGGENEERTRENMRELDYESFD